MPRKPLTQEENNLQILESNFKKANRADNSLREDGLTLKNQLDTFDLDTNLGYYRKHGIEDDLDEEEFLKLEFEEKYKTELDEKYDKYSEAFAKVFESYQKTKKLQKEKIELEAAKKAQDELIEAAKKEGSNLVLPPISTDVPGLVESRKEFNKLLFKSNTLAREIRDFEKPAKHNAMLAEAMKPFYDKQAIKDAENKKKIQEAAKKAQEEARLEEEKRNREANPEAYMSDEERHVYRIKKEKEAADAREAQAKNEILNKIGNLEAANRQDIISESNQREIEKLFKRYKVGDELESKQTYKVPAFKKPITLKEYYDHTIKNVTQARINNLKFEQKDFNRGLSVDIDRGLKTASIVVDETIPNPDVSIHDRVPQFARISSYVASNATLDVDSKSLDAVKVSQLITFTNKLAQIHNKSEKPGFFSRLFNTKYNKAYKAEQNMINDFKTILADRGHMDPEFLHKITDKSTCYKAVKADDVTAEYYKGLQNIDPKHIAFKNPENEAILTENAVKLQVIHDIAENKSPIDRLTKHLRGYVDIDEQSVPQPKEELEADRVQMNLEELAPEKQRLEEPIKTNEEPQLVVENTLEK